MECCVYSYAGFEKIITTGIGNVQGLTIDYSNQLLYWTDRDLGHIEMAALNCRCDVASCLQENGVCRKIIVHFDNDDHEDKPRGIAVGFGKIYWSDWGSRPRIESALQVERRKFSEHHVPPCTVL